jgi:hypothetical protein
VLHGGEEMMKEKINEYEKESKILYLKLKGKLLIELQKSFLSYFFSLYLSNYVIMEQVNSFRHKLCYYGTSKFIWTSKLLSRSLFSLLPSPPLP